MTSVPTAGTMFAQQEKKRLAKEKAARLKQENDKKYWADKECYQVREEGPPIFPLSKH